MIKKRDYKKPKITKIKLVPEEVLTDNCKAVPGDGTLKDGYGCNMRGCKKIGS